MKKIFTILAIATMMMVSCTKDGISVNEINSVEGAQTELSNGITYIAIPEGITSVVGYNYADGTMIGPMEVKDGKVGIMSNAPTTIELYAAPVTKASAGEYIGSYLIDGTAKWISIDNASSKLKVTDAQYFRQIFAAGNDNVTKYSKNAPTGVDDFGLDFLYKSNGLSFNIYPIYSMGYYDLKLGIFYYDEKGAYHEALFWDMVSNNWGKKSYAELVRTQPRDTRSYEITKTNADGFTISLPKGTLFGFFVDNDVNDGYSGKYSTYTGLNKNGSVHAASFSHNGMDYMGFEDQQGGDNDLNDLICYITPQQEIILNPTEQTIKDAGKDIDCPENVPEEIEKIIHVGHNNPDVDVQTRLQAPYPYMRINVPIKDGDDFQVDLAPFEEMVAPQDDVRIVIADDKTISDEVIKVLEKDHVVSVKVNGHVEDGERQLKIELRPVEDYYQALCNEMKKMCKDDYKWDELCKNKK